MSGFWTLLTWVRFPSDIRQIRTDKWTGRFFPTSQSRISSAWKAVVVFFWEGYNFDLRYRISNCQPYSQYESCQVEFNYFDKNPLRNISDSFFFEENIYNMYKLVEEFLSPPDFFTSFSWFWKHGNSWLLVSTHRSRARPAAARLGGVWHTNPRRNVEVEVEGSGARKMGRNIYKNIKTI